MMEKIKKDFRFLEEEKEVLGILLFGSRAKKNSHQKSDYDICIVAPSANPSRVLGKTLRNLNTKNYDVHIFEELPLHLKMRVIKNHEIIFTRDKYEMFEYFYFYRKLWKDQEHRNTMTKKELLQLGSSKR